MFFYRDRKLSERLALSIGMFTRGEVGAGIIFIALGYNLGGPAFGYFSAYSGIESDSDGYLRSLGEEFGFAELCGLT